MPSWQAVAQFSCRAGHPDAAVDEWDGNSAGFGTDVGVQVSRAGRPLAVGEVSRWGWRAHHRRLLPGVDAPLYAIAGGSNRRGMVVVRNARHCVRPGGIRHAHGARWVADDIPIELNVARHKSPAGVAVRRTLSSATR